MTDIAIFLFSKSSIIADPWANAGVECHLFDLGLTDSVDGNLIKHGGDIRNHRKKIGKLLRENNCVLIGSFAPCTDTTLAGTRHFEKKSLNDSLFWARASELIRMGIDLAEYFDVPYFFENPKSVTGTLIDRKPDYKFHPWMFGGYLKEDHQHSLFPEIYPGKDAYVKETWIWSGNGFVFPDSIPVQPVSSDFPGWKKLGGKSERTKEIRSCTPEGFSKAIFEANYKKELTT
jgi:hypothetical protein